MLHIIQNDPEVPAGAIAEYLNEWNLLSGTVRLYAGETLPALGDLSSVIVLGGTMGAYDDVSYPYLAGLKLWTRSVVAAGIPYLGICLGGQLLAAAHGGEVHPNRWGEEGMASVTLTAEGWDDRLFSGVGSDFSTFQWHHDSFDIPPGGVLLARSPDCANQAFRIGAAAWGTQFHPEVTEDIIRGWCAIGGKSSARTAEILTVWRSGREKYREAARRLLQNFLRVAGKA